MKTIVIIMKKPPKKLFKYFCNKNLIRTTQNNKIYYKFYKIMAAAMSTVTF